MNDVVKILSQLNRIQKYLGNKEIGPDSEGATVISSDERSSWDYDYLEIKNNIGYYHSWDVSRHNGDLYNHQIRELSKQELLQKLDAVKNLYLHKAEKRIKSDLEKEAIKTRMIELGFLES